MQQPEDHDELEREPHDGQVASDTDVQAERQEEGVQGEIDHEGE